MKKQKPFRLLKYKGGISTISKLNSLQTELLKPGSIAEKSKAITDAVVEIFDADFCRIWLINKGDLCSCGCMHAEITEGPHVCRYRDKCLFLTASSGRYTHIDGKVHRRVPFSCYKIGRVAAEQDSKFLTNDVTRDPRVHDNDWAAKLGLVSFVGYQLRPPDGETIGVLALFSKHEISPDEDALLESVARITAQVAQTCRTEDDLRAAKEDAELLNEQLRSEIDDRKKTEQLLQESESQLKETNQSLMRVADKISISMTSVIEGSDKKETLLFENSEMINCRQVKNCDRTDCPAYSESEPTRCWEIAGTFCQGQVQGYFAKKIKDCCKCEVYQQARTNPVSNLGESFNTMITVLADRQAELEKAKETALSMMEDAENARKDAEQANKAKSQFLANMSHEIRTPMNAIIGFGDILTDEELTSRQRGYVDTICSSSRHLLQLINDILDFSKIEAGQLNTEIVDCSLARLLGPIESLITPKATEKELELKILTSDNLPAKIRTDPTRLRQCLINLIGNAIKFTKTGFVHINVSVEQADTKPFIRFDIEDTGIGIAPDKQQWVFESFTQADGNTSRKYGGTGLGLAITKQLAELLGGTLTMTSQQGKGSVFSLAIPAGLDITNQPVLDRHNLNSNTYTGKDRRPRYEFSGHVLVAEDIETNQMLAKSLLTRMGFEVTIADDGKQALQKASSQKFDLIFMDVQMPNMNGYEATHAIKQQAITTPIIAMTACTMKGDEQKCLDAGCDDYLAKPIDRRELQSKIIKHLSSQPKTLIAKSEPAVPQAKTSTEDSGTMVDWDNLIGRLGDEQLVREIIPTYLADSRDIFEKLTAAVQAADAKEIKRQGHAIKGIARNLGVTTVSDISARLETAGFENDVEAAVLLFNELKPEFEKLLAFLSQPDWIEIAKTSNVVNR